MQSDLFAIIAPVLVCAALGFGWAKSGRPYATDFVTTLTANLALPCLIFAALTRLEISPAAVAEMSFAAGLSMLCFAAIGMVALPLIGIRVRQFLPSLIWTNSGNVGLPLCLFAFGEPGLALGVAYFAVTVVGQFTIGVWLNAGRASPLVLVQAPVVYGVLAALVFLVAERRPPEWLLGTTNLIGSLTIPLMLITLGVSLASLKVTALRVSLWLTLLRALSGVPVALAIAAALGFTGAARGVLIIQAAMPIALTNYLLAQRYGGAAAEVAAACVISTVLSFLTLPLLLMLVL